MSLKIVALFALVAVVASKPSPHLYGSAYGSYGYPVATSYSNRVDGYYGAPVIAKQVVPVYSGYGAAGYGLGYGGAGYGYEVEPSVYGGYGTYGYGLNHAW